MKLLKKPKSDVVAMPEKWECFDGCPVCRLFIKSIEDGREFSGKELEEAFTRAEKQTEV